MQEEKNEELKFKQDELEAEASVWLFSFPSFHNEE